MFFHFYYLKALALYLSARKYYSCFFHHHPSLESVTLKKPAFCLSVNRLEEKASVCFIATFTTIIVIRKLEYLRFSYVNPWIKRPVNQCGNNSRFKFSASVFDGGGDPFVYVWITGFALRPPL